MATTIPDLEAAARALDRLYLALGGAARCECGEVLPPGASLCMDCQDLAALEAEMRVGNACLHLVLDCEEP